MSEIVAGSTVYVHLPVIADHDLTGDTFEVSTDLQTWTPATVVSTGTDTYDLSILHTFDAGTTTFYSRITDSPEVPILKHGSLYAAAS